MIKAKSDILSKRASAVIIIVFLLLSCSFVKAQNVDTQSEILLMGKNERSKITLRWRIDNYSDYALARETGFIVEQKIVDKNQSFASTPFKKIETVTVGKKEAFLEKIKVQRTNRSLLASAAILFPDTEPEVNKKDVSGHINLVNKLNQQHSILLLQADLDITSSRLLGLRYELENINANKDYYFRIKSIVSDNNEITSNIIRIDGNVQHSLPIPDITQVAEGDSLITLQWEKDKHNAFFIAYLIERAGSSGRFENIVSLPFIYSEDPLLNLDDEFIHYNHEVENNKTYDYRIRGISPFGELSKYSNIIKATAQDRTAPNVPDSLWLSYNDKGYVILEWEYNNSAASGDLLSTHIERSQMVDAQFLEIGKMNNSLGENKYADTIDDTNPYYFYRLRLSDINNNISFTNPVSIQIPDTIAPAPPVLVSATIDTLGHVNIIWEQNKEKDLLGYQVYTANNEKGIYTNLSNKAYLETEWSTDLDLKYLNKDIFYKLQSLDKHYNHSDLSDPIRLIRHDITPPLPAYFKDYIVRENTIEFQWEKSNSSDLTKQYLLRRQLGEKKWTLLGTFDNLAENYLDASTKQGIIYEYDLVSADELGNETHATDLLRLKAIGKIKLDAINNFSMNYNSETKSVDLSWEQSSEDVRNYILFRSINNGPYRSLQTLKPTILSTKDYNLKPGNKYKYYIIAVSRKGKKTQKSLILNHVS